MNKTGISYLDFSWNPIVGCSPASGRGCDNCWAKAMARRLAANPSISDADRACYQIAVDHWNGDGMPAFFPDRLHEPSRRKKPAVIGVGFMSDLWHPRVPSSVRMKILGEIASCPHHRFVVTTKRSSEIGLNADEVIPANLLVGVSVSGGPDLWRVDELCENTRDTVLRWISLEPQVNDVVALNLTGIDWVVQGCESGPGRRPFDIQWAQSVRDQCVRSGVWYYLKQMPVNGKVMVHPPLDFERWTQVPSLLKGDDDATL